MKVRVLSVFGICFSLLYLYGCAVTPEKWLEQKERQLIAQGNSKDFAEGYTDGCASGKCLIGDENYKSQKDKARYMKARDYSIGWERGYYDCRDEDITKLQQEVHQEYIPTDDAAEEMEREKIWEELRK